MELTVNDDDNQYIGQWNDLGSGSGGEALGLWYRRPIHDVVVDMFAASVGASVRSE